MARQKDIQRWLLSWATLWRVPSFARSVTVIFNPRLKSSWARVRYDSRTISLHPDLERAPGAVIREVLCHELAHLAVHVKHKRRVAPHGAEWAQFVRRAGFRPTSKLGGPGLTSVGKLRAPVHFEHRCPVCQTIRIGRRPINAWRCAACVAAGLDGALVVRRLPAQEPYP